MNKIGIIGAGTWGVALANTLAKAKNEVRVYSVIKEEIDNLNKTHKHPNLKKDILDDKIIFTFDIYEALNDAEYIIMAVPSKFVRQTTTLIKNIIKESQIIINVAKGLESDTLMTLSSVIEDELNNPHIKVIALCGPSHAEEVAIDMPTTIVAAYKDINVARKIQHLFKDTCIRVYANDDILGVELYAAIKNIIALGVGIATGLGFGDNTKAALITRGMAEIKRLGMALGAKENTFAGLSGIGDLIVTATSNHSRNNKFGNLLGQGQSYEEALKNVGMVVEGLNAIEPTLKLAAKYRVDMPITKAIDNIINHNVDPKETVYLLMNRDFKDE